MTTPRWPAPTSRTTGGTSPGADLGVVAGLVPGKLVGISVASGLVLRLVPGARVPGLDLPRVAGGAGLSGMGFTISLLVVGIAIADPSLQDQARVGVLTASLLALVVGWAAFRVGDRVSPLPPPHGDVLQRDVDPSRDHVRGAVDARATLVVYTAMDRRYRHQTAEAVADVRRRLGDGARVVLRHHTCTDADRTAALAPEAAAGQGASWELHDALVAVRPRHPDADPADDLDVDVVRAAAADVGLDVDRFAGRLRRAEDTGRVEDDDLDAQ